MGSVRAADTRATTPRRGQRQTLAQPSKGVGRHLVGTSHRSTLDGPTQAVPTVPDLPPPVPAVGTVGTLRRAGPSVASLSSGLGGARKDRPIRVFHRRHLYGGEKGPLCWKDQARQKYKDHGGCRPFFSSTRRPHWSASPHEVTHEVTLVERTLEARFTVSTRKSPSETKRTTSIRSMPRSGPEVSS